MIGYCDRLWDPSEHHCGCCTLVLTYLQYCDLPFCHSPIHGYTHPMNNWQTVQSPELKLVWNTKTSQNKNTIYLMIICYWGNFNIMFLLCQRSNRTIWVVQGKWIAFEMGCFRSTVMEKDSQLTSTTLRSLFILSNMNVFNSKFFHNASRLHNHQWKSLSCIRKKQIKCNFW